MDWKKQSDAGRGHNWIIMNAPEHGVTSEEKTYFIGHTMRSPLVTGKWVDSTDENWW